DAHVAPPRHARERLAQHNRASREQDGVGGREKIRLGASQREEDVEEDEHPAERAIRLAFGSAEVKDEARDNQRQVEQVHREELADEEVQWRTRREPTIVAPELLRRPAVGELPDEPGDKKRKGNRAAKPRPARAEIVAAGGQQYPHDQAQTEEK